MLRHSHGAVLSVSLAPCTSWSKWIWWRERMSCLKVSCLLCPELILDGRKKFVLDVLTVNEGGSKSSPESYFALDCWFLWDASWGGGETRPARWDFNESPEEFLWIYGWFLTGKKEWQDQRDNTEFKAFISYILTKKEMRRDMKTVSCVIHLNENAYLQEPVGVLDMPTRAGETKILRCCTGVDTRKYWSGQKWSE